MLQLISLIPNEEGFQPRADKLIDGPLYLFPIGAVIAQHDFIDGQAASSKVRRLCDISQVT